VIAVQRNLFKLDPKASSSIGSKILNSDYQIEEHVYFRNDPNEEEFIDTGIKRYILRGPPNKASATSSSDYKSTDDTGRRRRMTRVGPPIFSIEIQELVSNDKNAPGTGSSTWEASIAMCIFISSCPDVLQGNVLELGSGVGLAGIFSSLCAGAVDQISNDDKNNREVTYFFPDMVESISFTDYSDDVLDVCRMNAKKYFSDEKYSVKKLDWYENYISSSKDANQYNTILGTDCAYLFPDVKPLARTIASNLATVMEGGKAFMLGPFNRDAMHYLQTQLAQSYEMDLDVGVISMDAFQLETVWLQNIKEKKDVERSADDGSKIYFCEFTSKTNTKYLMLEAMHHKDFLGGEDSKAFFRDAGDDNDARHPFLGSEL